MNKFLRFQTLLSATLLTTVLAGAAPSRAFTVSIHADMTTKQLTELTATINGSSVGFSSTALDQIAVANTATDDPPTRALDQPTLHFTNEKFEDSRKALDAAVADVLRLVRQPTPDGTAARERLGRALHAVQDFYSHTNWVERGETDLVDLESELTNPAKTGVPCKTDDPNVLAGGAAATSGYVIGDFQTLDPFNTACRNLPRQGACWHGNYFTNCRGINKDFATREEALAVLKSKAGFFGSPFFGLDDVAEPQETHGDAVLLAARHTKEFVQKRILDELAGNDAALLALLDVRGTISFVVDDTGSMGEEIQGVRNTVNRIATQLNSQPARRPSNFQLVRFGDPDVGPAFLTSDITAFRTRVNALRAGGGGDCPELSQQGILLALNNALPGGDVFVFTDASAKDSNLANAVIQKALDKNIRLLYGLTGSCSPIDPAYERGAAETGGQVLFVNQFEVERLFDLVEPQLPGNLGTVLSTRRTLSATVPSTESFPVDSKASSLLISIINPVPGAIAEFEIRTPSGRLVASTDPGVRITLLNTASSISIATVANPQAGEWRVTTRGTGDTELLVRVASDIKLQSFNFVKPSNDIHGGVFRTRSFPLPNRTAMGEAVLLGPVATAQFALLGTNGSIANVPLAKNFPAANPTHYIGEFVPPSTPFRVFVEGEDANGFRYRRILAAQLETRPVSVELMAQRGGTIAAGVDSVIPFRISNVGTAPRSYNLVSVASIPAMVSLTPSTIALAPGATADVRVTLRPAASTPANTALELQVTATDRDDTTQFNSATTPLLVGVPPVACDIDRDGDIDRNDVNVISASLNQMVEPGNPADPDLDRKITALDARQCVLRCTRAQCAVD